MSTSLSTDYFRYVKPEIQDFTLEILAETASTVIYSDTQFTNSITVGRAAGIDVISNNVPLSNHILLNGGTTHYQIVNGVLTMNIPGTYWLRRYADPATFSGGLISMKRFAFGPNQGNLEPGVPFFPQVLTPAIQGYAKVANNLVDISYVPRSLGSDSFSYRLVNIYGQVTEPKCIFVKVVTKFTVPEDDINTTE